MLVSNAGIIEFSAFETSIRHHTFFFYLSPHHPHTHSKRKNSKKTRQSWNHFKIENSDYSQTEFLPQPNRIKRHVTKKNRNIKYSKTRNNQHAHAQSDKKIKNPKSIQIKWECERPICNLFVSPFNRFIRSISWLAVRKIGPSHGANCCACLRGAHTHKQTKTPHRHTVAIIHSSIIHHN